jgi:hypothetical protein
VNSNPYSSSDSECRFSSLHLIKSAARAIAYFYPLTVAMFLYATWGLAAWKLGRPPIPYREYPDGADIAVLAYTTALLHFLSPLAVPAGALVSLVYPFGNLINQSASVLVRMMSFLTYIAFCVIVLVVLFQDPYGVVDWFWD